LSKRIRCHGLPFVLVVAALVMLTLLGRELASALCYLGWRLYPVLVGFYTVQSLMVLLAWPLICYFWPSLVRWRRIQSCRLRRGRWKNLGRRSGWLLVLTVNLVAGPAPSVIAALAIKMSLPRTLLLVTAANLIASLMTTSIVLWLAS
jgi:hypothetical protein